MTDTIRGGIVGATVTQGGSGWVGQRPRARPQGSAGVRAVVCVRVPGHRELMPSLRLCGERICFLGDTEARDHALELDDHHLRCRAADGLRHTVSRRRRCR